MPIPTADLPGHKALRERSLLALDLCQEQPGIDFKRSEPWDALKWRLIKTCLAMANLRGGGLIVVGVTEGPSSWELHGIEPAHLATYDVDLVVDAVNAFASPHVDIDLVLVRHATGKDFLSLQVREFELAPIICRKNGPENIKDKLEEGTVYVRPPGMAKTTKVTQAAQMADLLQLAAEKQARRLLEMGARVGLQPAESDLSAFEKELKIPESSLPILKEIEAKAHWRVLIRPATYVRERIGAVSELRKVFEACRVRWRGWDYPYLENKHLSFGENWIGSWNEYHPESWRLFQSGQFVDQFRLIELGWKREAQQVGIAAGRRQYGNDVPGFVNVLNLLYTVYEIVEFGARLAQRAGFEQDVQFSLELRNVKDFALSVDFNRAWMFMCQASENRLKQERRIPVAELLSDAQRIAVDMAVWFYERFGWENIDRAILDQDAAGLPKR